MFYYHVQKRVPVDFHYLIKAKNPREAIERSEHEEPHYTRAHLEQQERVDVWFVEEWAAELSLEINEPIPELFSLGPNKEKREE